MIYLQILFTLLSIEGWSWFLTKSKLLNNFRSYIKDKSIVLHELLSCIVCVSFWVGLLHTFFMYGNELKSLYDCFLFLGSTLAFTTIVALYTGDAD
jgi:hypothetical protein